MIELGFVEIIGLVILVMGVAERSALWALFGVAVLYFFG